MNTTNESQQFGIEDYQLNHAVMRRVWAVYFVRSALHPEAVKFFVFAACCGTAFFMVSVANVISNVSHLSNILDGAFYIYGAFLNTSIVVEATIVIALGAGAWLAYDATRNLGGAIYHMTRQHA